MSRRRTYSDSELDLLSKLKRENQKLKGEVSKLRKQIDRLDLDRFQSFKEALDKLDEIEMEQAAKRRDKQLSKDRWRCWDCGQGQLRLKIWDRRDGQRYQRVCDLCGKRTSIKKYTPEVKE